MMIFSGGSFVTTDPSQMKMWEDMQENSKRIKDLEEKIERLEQKIEKLSNKNKMSNPYVIQRCPNTREITWEGYLFNPDSIEANCSPPIYYWTDSEGEDK